MVWHTPFSKNASVCGLAIKQIATVITICLKKFWYVGHEFIQQIVCLKQLHQLATTLIVIGLLLEF